MKRLLTLCIALLIGCAVAAQQPTYQFDRQIAYRASDDAYVRQMCCVDVAYPADAVSAPVIVWFHGGGLTGGERDLPEQLLKSGCVVVGVGYRLSPKVTVSEIIDDAAAAVAWTFDHAQKYGGDPARIYLAGHSAGGYLVNMIGLNRAYLARYDRSPDLLAAIVPFSGQVITHFEQRRTLGMAPLQPLVDSLAPLYHVRGDAPPMLLLSGDRELELYGRYEETAYFWRMLKLAGHKDVILYELDGFDHGAMCQPGYQLLVKYIKNREKR
ncbi:MAG: alpha/beta hydrolase fold domain-containing protein [Alistipes sp.]